MATIHLEIEHDYEFELLGISSHLPDYRLCWMLNRSLNINLSRSNNPIKIAEKSNKEIQLFDLFSEWREGEQQSIYLIDNIVEGRVLLPEIKNIDYILLLKGGRAGQLTAWKKEIQGLDHVLAVMQLDVNKLKSKEKLLIDGA